MKKYLLKVLIVLLAPSLIGIQNAHAYIGPGAGIGAILAVVFLTIAAIIIIIGLVWYPAKRVLKKIKKEQEHTKDGNS